MYSYDRTETVWDAVLEALFEHANHNKRLTREVVQLLKQGLQSSDSPSWVIPAKGVVYRGDHTSPQKLFQDVGETLPSRGSKKVTLSLQPGSSWSYDLEQAQYHGTSGTLNPEAEVLYTTSTSTGSWFDMRELYQMSRFRGLRLEREVIGLDTKVPCKAQWVLPAA